MVQTHIGVSGSPYGYKVISDAERQDLIHDLRACQGTNNLVQYDTRADGSWWVVTYDDAQWPAFYRCMKAAGYTPDGPDYTQQTNFGRR